MSENTNTKRIAKNTLMLYFRQILIMVVSLYTVRVVLNVLGAEDYGIYNVVAGVVTMFNFLSNSMATASQRYFSYDLGKQDKDHLRITFNVTYQIYLLLILIVVLVAETAGLWFVNSKLVIPESRMFAANCIYQASILSFCFTLVTTPYMAAIIANEKMNIYAYVGLIDAGLRLGIVFILKLLPYDKLIIYGFLLLLVAFINTSIYRIYCHKKFEECKFYLVKDGKLLKEIMSYSGWNLFGSFAGVCKGQITNIVLNMFFGPVVNSARSIASQVNNALASFAQNFSTAIRPQVIKTYASENMDECFKLVFRGSKFTFFLMYIFACPLLFEMDFILQKWLGVVPAQSALFTRFIIIETLIDTMSFQLMTLSQATGRIKVYQGVVGGLLLFNLPVSYIILRLGAPAIAVCIVSMTISIVAFIARLVILKKLVCISVLRFVTKVIVPCGFVTLLSSLQGVILVHTMPCGFTRFCISLLSLVTVVILLIIFIGITREERDYLVALIKSKLGQKK